MDIKAIAVDTGGTVLDWHSGLVRAFDRVAAQHAHHAHHVDSHALANDWRRRAMQGIVGQVQPAFHMDDVHRSTLDATLAHFGLGHVSADERAALCRSWHELQAWPDVAAGLAALRAQLPVVSFTMLPLALVVAVSRRNGLEWDAIVSCQMLGVYKPRAEAYLGAARWLGLQPAQVLMVACHNFDLDAARAVGMHTAFVHRPDEWGPEGPPDPVPNPDCSWVVAGFDALHQRVLALLATLAPPRDQLLQAAPGAQPPTQAKARQP